MKMVAGRLIFSAAAVACLLAGTPAAMDVGRAGSVSPSSQVSEGARTVLPRSSSSETSKGSSSTSSSSSACEQDIVECGVSLTSISNWCVGECGTRVTTDPRVFGPHTWRTFHVFAQNYPTDPNEEAHRACVNFIMAIPYMLPCAHCGYDFQQFINASIEHEGKYSSDCAASKEYDMPCQGPEVACENQSNLINFFLRAHHNVDKHTKPCKQMWSQEMALDAYQNVTGFCSTCIVWGTVPICKTTDCSPN